MRSRQELTDDRKVHSKRAGRNLSKLWPGAGDLRRKRGPALLNAANAQVRGRECVARFLMRYRFAT